MLPVVDAVLSSRPQHRLHPGLTLEMLLTDSELLFHYLAQLIPDIPAEFAHLTQRPVFDEYLRYLSRPCVFTGKLKTEPRHGVSVMKQPIRYRKHRRGAYHVALELALLTDAARHAVQRQPSGPRPPVLALYDDADAPILPERLVITLLTLALVEPPYLIAGVSLDTSLCRRFDFR